MGRTRTDETVAPATDGSTEPDAAASPRRSRRAMLGGAVVAGAGIATGLLATAGTAGAATPRAVQKDLTPLIIGEDNQATSSTELDNTNGPCFTVTSTSGEPVFTATDNSTGGGNAGTAVTGTSSSSVGVFGQSASNSGVWGISTDSVGTVGQSQGSYGVSGETGTPDPTQTPGAAGVVGIDSSDAGTIGVWGTSSNGVGVNGTAYQSWGVVGQSQANGFGGVNAQDNSPSGGYGVYAETNAGVALCGASGTTTGTALQVFGRSSFSTAGVAVVAKAKKSVTVSVDTATTSSIVVATLQEAQSGTYVASAVAADGKITITLNEAATAARKVGYFVIG